MAYKIQDAKGELEAMLHGVTLNQINNINGVFNRAGRQLLLDIDPQETKRIEQTDIIYDSVYDYSAPSDLKGNKIIDIRPQVNRQLKDLLVQRFGQQFDLDKEFTRQSMCSVRFDQSKKSLRIEVNMRSTSVQMNAIDSVNSNGTWTGASGATNLQQDTINFADGAGALRFDVSAGSVAPYIENSTMSAVDLTNYQNTSSLFLWVFMPTATDVSSANLRFGSSSSDYWTISASTTHQGNSFNNGWNLIRFDWLNTTTQVGSPSVNLINYVRITLNTNGNAQTAMRVNALYDRIGLVFDIEYYSKFIFSDSSGNFKETTDNEEDTINLDTDSYNLFLWILAREAAYQQHSQNANFDISFYENNYSKAKEKYTKQYPSEVQKTQSTYYQTPERRWTRFLGRNYFG